MSNIGIMFIYFMGLLALIFLAIAIQEVAGQMLSRWRRKAEPKPAEEPAPTDRKIIFAAATKPLPFGSVAHGLTQIGDTWLRMENIVSVEFAPDNGFGCEISFSAHDVIQLEGDSAVAMRSYLDEVAQRAEGPGETK